MSHGTGRRRKDTSERGSTRLYRSTLHVWGAPGGGTGFSAYLKRTGYTTILDYCEAMCRKSIDCGILPHTNAGILTYDEMERLRAVNASMGLMLETTAKIPAHAASKGKEPEIRLGMIEDAGKLKIPFTTGLLWELVRQWPTGKNPSLQSGISTKGTGISRRSSSRIFVLNRGHQWHIIPVPGTDEICTTIRMARDILPKDIAIQIPPNLIDASVLISCGVDDLGGVSPLTIDYVNPEHPWPAIEELKKIVGDAHLRERLCIYPQYIKRGWYHPDLQPLINRLAQTVKARSSGS